MDELTAFLLALALRDQPPAPGVMRAQGLEIGGKYGKTKGKPLEEDGSVKRKKKASRKQVDPFRNSTGPITGSIPI